MIVLQSLLMKSKLQLESDSVQSGKDCRARLAFASRGQSPLQMRLALGFTCVHSLVLTLTIALSCILGVNQYWLLDFLRYRLSFCISLPSGLID